MISKARKARMSELINWLFGTARAYIVQGLALGNITGDDVIVRRKP
jgi:hypothetical protein